MDFKKLFRKDDKAVSPVIGVILMVAITVILAAAIGSSVFGQTGSKSAPQANFDVKAGSAYDSTKSPATTATIRIEHLGGETINFANSNAKLTASIDGTNSVPIKAESLGEFNVGDVKILELIMDDGSSTGMTLTNVTKGSTVNIKVSDVATNQLISDRTVKFV